MIIPLRQSVKVSSETDPLNNMATPLEQLELTNGRVVHWPETALWKITPVKLPTGHDPDNNGRNNGRR